MFKKIILAFILSFFLSLEFVAAATGIGVRPLRTNIKLEPGKNTSFYLTVINNENFTQVVKPEFQTYTSHNEQGYPVAKKMEDDDPENIQSWISFEKDNVSVAPKSEKKVKVTVTVPENAEPGGRYGALIYGPILTNTSGVSFRTRVASLLLLDVAGDEKYNGEIYKFGLKDGKIYSDKGVQMEVGFENKGNIHVSPKGTVSIFDNDDKKIQSIFFIIDKDGKKVVLNDVPVNPYLNYTLPKLKRLYPADWKYNLSEGEFKAKLKLVYKKGDNKKTENFTEEKELKINIKDELTLESFDFLEEDGKTYFILKFKNNGTVYEKLKGSIDILNNLDYKIGEVKIPADIQYIAPGKLKEFKLKFLDKKMPKGDYSLKSNVSYGVSGKKLELEKEFSFGSNWILYFSILILILILIYLWKKKKTKESLETVE